MTESKADNYMNCPHCGSFNLYRDLRDKVNSCHDCGFTHIVGEQTVKDARETIIQQDNDQTTALLAATSTALEAWKAAADEWKAANNAPAGVDGHRTLEAAAALDQAINDHHRATRALAAHLESLWKAGYRLTMPS